MEWIGNTAAVMQISALIALEPNTVRNIYGCRDHRLHNNTMPNVHITGHRMTCEDNH